jgi:UDP-N-acetylglucosamine--N-acetylmuramyl-(pentapeptide) pyrophosphoryl-undecaprenol N-acetylglucosamine transferase
MTTNTYLIMAGGTGGHVFPGLAVAQALIAAGHRVEWLGTAKGIEANLVPAAGIRLHCLNIAGIRGRGIKSLLAAPWLLLKAIYVVTRLLRELKPAAVIGLGGYVAGPGGLAARLAGVPLVIHEQNAVAGTTNRWLARIATRVLTAFPDVLPSGICIGNPVRASISALPAPRLRAQRPLGPLRLLVLGGSLGAQALNQLLPQALSRLELELRPEVWHQAGRLHCQSCELAYRERQVAAQVEPFIADMAQALSWADLVICRAGALTIAELCAAGVGALLVPYPHAIDDHQTANARWLVSRGGALLCPQAELSSETLLKHLRDFHRDRDKVLAMAEAARVASQGQATEAFLQQILELPHG